MKRKDFSDLEIEVQNDREVSFEHENYIAGNPPFLRGIDTTMYLQKPIKTQLLVNFSSPEKSNAFIKEHILKGYKAYVLDINTVTSLEITSGISITSIDAMKTVLNEIPLKDLSITLSTNNSIITVFGLFIAATKQLGIPQEHLNLSLNLTPENSIIDTDFHQNTIESILNYTTKNLPKFNTISIATQKADTEKTTETDFAYFLAATFENLTYCISKGMKINTIASKISYNYTIGEHHFSEISKMRAARMLWAKMILQFNPKQQQSLKLQIHSLNYFSDYNKVLTALLGGVQSVISTNIITQFIKQETYILKTVDPWAGSTSIEKITEEISHNTWLLFEEIQNKGGFSQLLHKENLTQTALKNENSTKNLLELIIKNFEKNVTLEQLYKNIKI